MEIIDMFNVLKKKKHQQINQTTKNNHQPLLPPQKPYKTKYKKPRQTNDKTKKREVIELSNGQLLQHIRTCLHYSLSEVHSCITNNARRSNITHNSAELQVTGSHFHLIQISTSISVFITATML